MCSILMSGSACVWSFGVETTSCALAYVSFTGTRLSFPDMLCRCFGAVSVDRDRRCAYGACSAGPRNKQAQDVLFSLASRGSHDFASIQSVL